MEYCHQGNWRINILQIEWETYPVKSSSLSLSGTFITVDGRTREAVEVDDATGRGVSHGRATVGLKPFPTRIPRPPSFPFPVSCSSQPSVPCVFLSCSWILQEETPGGTGNCVQCPPQPHDEREHEVNILENILPKRVIIITGKKWFKSKVVMCL